MNRVVLWFGLFCNPGVGWRLLRRHPRATKGDTTLGTPQSFPSPRSEGEGVGGPGEEYPPAVSAAGCIQPSTAARAASVGYARPFAEGKKPLLLVVVVLAALCWSASCLGQTGRAVSPRYVPVVVRPAPAPVPVLVPRSDAQDDLERMLVWVAVIGGVCWWFRRPLLTVVDSVFHRGRYRGRF
jgi:hypothetical protein